MIWESDQVNSNLPSQSTESFGQKLSQKLVEVSLKLLKVNQLTSQFSQNASPRRRSLKVMAGLVDGDTQGGSKDQNGENVVNLDIASTSLQGELAEKLYRKLVHIVAIQAIIKTISHDPSNHSH